MVTDFQEIFVFSISTVEVMANVLVSLLAAL